MKRAALSSEQKARAAAVREEPRLTRLDDGQLEALRRWLDKVIREAREWAARVDPGRALLEPAAHDLDTTLAGYAGRVIRQVRAEQERRREAGR